MATPRAIKAATIRLLEFIEFAGLVEFFELLGFVEFVELPLLIEIDDHFEKISKRVRIP